jgi:metal-responsive CopG/Arc/MetJ family transcriptional regulator
VTFVKTQLKGGLWKMAHNKKQCSGPVSISMKPDLGKRLMAAAKERGQTRSAFVRDLLVKALDGDNGQQDDGQKA